MWRLTIRNIVMGTPMCGSNYCMIMETQI